MDNQSKVWLRQGQEKQAHQPKFGKSTSGHDHLQYHGSAEAMLDPGLPSSYAHDASKGRSTNQNRDYQISKFPDYNSRSFLNFISACLSTSSPSLTEDTDFHNSSKWGWQRAAWVSSAYLWHLVSNLWMISSHDKAWYHCFDHAGDTSIKRG